MTVALYARVSTADQHCESQLRELRDYAKRRKWKVDREYIDQAQSGVKRNRPALDRLMKDASQHLFDCILVYKIDRFSRSVLHLSQQVDDLRRYGVRFIATSQNLDTDESSPTAQLLLNVLGAVAEFEREMIRERVQSGIKTAKAKGVRFGRPQIVYDRLNVKELAEKGMSIRQIAEAKVLSRGTVHRCIADKEKM